MKTSTVGYPIEYRRNHSSCLIGSSMLIYAGINSTGDYKNDLWELNLKTSVW